VERRLSALSKRLLSSPRPLATPQKATHLRKFLRCVAFLIPVVHTVERGKRIAIVIQTSNPGKAMPEAKIAYSTRLRRAQVATMLTHCAREEITESRFIREAIDRHNDYYDRKLRKQVADRVALQMQKEQVNKVFLRNGSSDD
jgi:hypothetical protein